MPISEAARKLRKMIDKAIEDHKITRNEYEEIIHLATEDHVIDKHEQALLNSLQQMIEGKEIKIVP
jgi:transcriptional regulator CtsR